MKIVRLLNASGGSHDQRCSAAGGACNDAQGLTIGSHVAGDGRIRSDISQIERSGEESFNHGRSSVEDFPLDARAGTEGLFKSALCSSDKGLRMRDVWKIACAHRDACALRTRRTGRKEEHENRQWDSRLQAIGPLTRSEKVAPLCSGF